MVGKYFSKMRKESFYLPGEEIKIDRCSSFKSYAYDRGNPLSTCKNRVIFSAVCFVAVFSIISIRLFDLCVVPNFEANRQEASVEKAPGLNTIRRADIVDRNGTIIATSLPTVNLYANPRKVPNAEKAAHELVQILPGLNYKDVYKKLDSRSKFVYLKRNLTPSQQYQINCLGIPGLEFENGEKRIYPHKNLFAQVLGSTSIDNEGISGLEKAMNERLTQSDIPLKLTLDSGIQDTIREHLRAAVEKFSAIGATAVVMEANTSKIIAMVSLPDYDPNDSKTITDQAMFNMATKGVYEPGSVLKVFNTAMALESGKIKVADSFDATQPLKLRYNVIKDYRGENRWLSVPEILIYSSNIGSARMALKAGGNEQRNFLEKIGFFNELNIEVPEKASPLVPKSWGESTIATVAYGYGLAVTPLHIITGFSAIINGGVYHKPTLVQSDQADAGYRVVSYNTSKSMRELVRNVVTDGSGKRANVIGYEVGGKTGTANKLSEKGKYVDKKVRTTFMLGFPISNPQYTMILMLDEPQATKETWGFVTSGWNTVPTAKGIIDAIAPQLNVKANYDLDELRKNRIIEASY